MDAQAFRSPLTKFALALIPWIGWQAHQGIAVGFRYGLVIDGSASMAASNVTHTQDSTRLVAQQAAIGADNGSHAVILFNQWQSVLQTRGPFRLLGMPDLAKSEAALSHGSEWTARQYVSTMELTPSTSVSGIGLLSSNDQFNCNKLTRTWSTYPSHSGKSAMGKIALTRLLRRL